jgi:hypothetical protein
MVVADSRMYISVVGQIVTTKAEISRPYWARKNMAGMEKEPNDFWFKKTHYKAFLRDELWMTNYTQQSPAWDIDDLSTSQYTFHLICTPKFRQLFHKFWTFAPLVSRLIHSIHFIHIFF